MTNGATASMDQLNNSRPIGSIAWGMRRERDKLYTGRKVIRLVT